MFTILRTIALWVLGEGAVRLLVGAGLTVTFYTVASTFLTGLANQINTELGNFAGFQILMLAGFGQGLSIILSAVSALFVLKGARWALGKN